MVFNRVLPFRRSSRSADGKLEKSSKGSGVANKSFTRKGKVAVESPISTRTAFTSSPELSHATNDDISHQQTPTLATINSPTRTTRPPSRDRVQSPLRAADNTRGSTPPRKLGSVSLSPRDSGSNDNDNTWMRILPFEEKKDNEDEKQEPISTRKCQSMAHRKIPAIVHAGGQVMPAIAQAPMDNPFEEYEEEDNLMVVGRYVRTSPLVPPIPLEDAGDEDDAELDDFMPLTPCASQSLGPLNEDAFSQTIVAGNLIMTSSTLLLSSVVNLSVLKHSDTYLLQPSSEHPNPFQIRTPTRGSMSDPQKFLFAPPAAKTVRDSLQRHFSFHLARSRKGPQSTTVADDIEFEIPDAALTPPRLSAASPVRDDDDSDTTEHAQQPLTPSTVNTVVNDCLKANNVGAAVAVYQAYLHKQNSLVKHGGEHGLKSPSSSFSTPERCQSYHTSMSQSVVEDMDAQRADTLGKLAVLSLFAGQNKEAMQYALEAARMHKETSNRPLSTAMATMQVGMIHFATSRAGRALKAWREAMQLCCLAVGYDHPIVAVLLNNIGVLHYDSGDSMAAVRALEESLALQRSMLRSGLGAVHVDHALYQLATTMGNLALALEMSERYDRAISLLQESQSLYESVETSEGPADESYEAAEIVQENLERLLLLREKFLVRGRNEESLLHAESNSMGDASTTDGDRSTTLFGNDDGIPMRNGQAPWMVAADHHDYLLLGLVSKELTPRQRVREIVLTWFGRCSEEDDSIIEGGGGSLMMERTPFVPFSEGGAIEDRDPNGSLITSKASEADRSSTVGQPTSPERTTQELAVDADESVINADLNLQQIHVQALEHLDHHEIGDALDLFVSALKSHKIKYGEDHHLVGTALHNIGMVHLFAEEYLQAYGIFKEAARIRAIALGHDHPDVAASMVKIGLLQYAAMDVAAAIRTFAEVREIYLKTAGYAHPHLAKILNNIGVLRYEEGDFAGATRAFEIAYEYQRRLVEDHPGDSAVAEIAMGYTLANIGFLYHRQDELVSAVRLFEEARTTLIRHLLTTDPKVIMVQQNIEYLVGKGVDIGAPCEEGCQLTPAARTCLMQFSWRRPFQN